MMSLPIAITGSVIISLISLGAGLYLQRYAARLSEMLGMMVGMTFGMMTGLAVGTWLGLALDMFTSNTIAVLLGLAFGVGFGRMGGLMGMLDGGMGGVMGGMMGAMLGVMVGFTALAAWVTAALMMAVYVLSLVGLIRLVQTRCAQTRVIDPVCDMEVDPDTAKYSSVYQGQVIYFCAPACKRAFDKHPERYFKPAGQGAKSGA